MCVGNIVGFPTLTGAEKMVNVNDWIAKPWFQGRNARKVLKPAMACMKNLLILLHPQEEHGSDEVSGQDMVVF